MPTLDARTLLFTLSTLVTSPLAALDISGRVQIEDGTFVEQAKILAVAKNQVTYTDPSGEFDIKDCDSPCLILVTHPRFEELTLEVTDESTQTLTLSPKQEIFERIDVTASRGGSNTFTPLSVASTVIKPQEKAAPPTSLTELVEGVAGVAENGQPGLFQVYSIRGVSRHRVLTFIDGIPILGERRAGVSSSFLDPMLMGSVDVLRGPSSTYYGSGALGGIVQVFPRKFDGFSFETGWDSFGDENFQALGWGDDGWSLGLVRRSVGADEVGDGTPQPTQYDQVSATLAKTWQKGDLTYDLLLVPTFGDDIGKPNTQFPDRVTTYPEERHLLFKFGIRSEKGWTFDAYAHPNSLLTEVSRVGRSFTVVDNDALDIGANFQRERQIGKAVGRFGVEYFGRRSVDSEETIDDFSSGTSTFKQSLDAATQDELSAFGSLRWSIGSATWQAGSRFTFHQQDNGSNPSRDDTAWTAFVGMVRPLGKGFELTANAGTGLRFPNLSERFFFGTTGRGEVLGNPDLEPESSINVDLGVRWFGARSFVSAQIFHLDIDDYIERIEVEDGRLTFVNLVSGKIEGFELEGFYQLNDSWLFNWSGHLIDGDADDGTPLADISADRVQLGLDYNGESWTGRIKLQHRTAKNDPGSGEMAIPSAELLSASIGYQLTEGLRLTLRGRNLLDEVYFSSADDVASAAPGRSFGVSLAWGG